jgi:hypothetical protein
VEVGFFEVTIEDCGAYYGREGEEDELDRDDYL